MLAVTAEVLPKNGYTTKKQTKPQKGTYNALGVPLKRLVSNNIRGHCQICHQSSSRKELQGSCLSVAEVKIVRQSRKVREVDDAVSIEIALRPISDFRAK